MIMYNYCGQIIQLKLYYKLLSFFLDLPKLSYRCKTAKSSKNNLKVQSLF